MLHCGSKRRRKAFAGMNTLTRSPQAISYVRFSSMRQTAGTSVERQEEMIGKWLLDNPQYTRSTLEYEDLAKSGFHGEHIRGGGFGKLLEAVRQGAIQAGDVVLVEAIDRTGRLDAVDMLGILHPILSSGVSLITLDDGTVYNRESLNGAGLFILSAKIQSAHQYSAALSRRITVTYNDRRKAAKEGITPKRHTPVWLTSEGAKKDAVAKQVAIAFELYISGVGKSTIAKRMRESGVKELAKCSGPTVDGWLQNRAAIGEWAGHIVYPNIVTLSTFQKAQMHRERVATSGKKTATNFHVGLVKCGSCGKNYIVQNVNGKPHSMRCRQHQNNKTCDNGSVLPLPVVRALMAFTADDAKRKAVSSLHSSINETEIAALRAEVDSLTGKIKGLVESVQALGAIPELLEPLGEHKAERDSHEARIAFLERSVSSGSYWATEGDVWRMEADDPQRLSSLLQQVGFAITVNADKTITTTGTGTVWQYVKPVRKPKSNVTAGFQVLRDGEVMVIGVDDYVDTGVERRSDDPFLEILDA
ncbi:recombinase family protein [Pseudomonas kurunegalensis]|uniref:recombinase family protein n=1 Tax=Pseudomonas kurunegalensis TaxID=485880 RepID=UPI004028581F